MEEGREGNMIRIDGEEKRKWGLAKEKDKGKIVKKKERKESKVKRRDGKREKL